MVERRVALMRELGIVFELGADVSDPKVTARLDDFDAVVVAAGARAPRGFRLRMWMRPAWCTLWTT